MTAQEQADVGRRRRDRDATTRDLLAAARRLLHRDGVLAGLNLREVADEARVNRGLIYQYFGSRQELLRAALADIDWHGADAFERGRRLPFPARRLHVFRTALRFVEFIKLEALLALDGDEGLRLFPQLDRSRQDLARDQSTGDLDPDVDPIAAHMLTAATYLGYCVFREQLAREAGLSPTALDGQVIPVYARMVEALSRRDPATQTAAGVPADGHEPTDGA